MDVERGEVQRNKTKSREWEYNVSGRKTDIRGGLTFLHGVFSESWLGGRSSYHESCDFKRWLIITLLLIYLEIDL